MATLEENLSYEASESVDDVHIIFHGPPPDYVILASIELQATPQTTDNAQPLRCECTDTMTVHVQEILISNNLAPQSPNSHVSSDIPYYIQNMNEEEAVASLQSPDVDEEAQRYESLPNLNVSLQDFTGDTELTDATPPLEPFSYGPLSDIQLFQDMARPTALAIKVTNRVINYARAIKKPYEKDVSCLNCGFLPVCPVTGRCGHTRCTMCIRDKGRCPCGDDPPEELHVNVLIRDLVAKVSSNMSTSRIVKMARSSSVISRQTNPLAITPCLNKERQEREWPTLGPLRRKRSPRSLASTLNTCCSTCDRFPVTPRAQYNHALELIRAKRYWEAAPLLAVAAATCHSNMRAARLILTQVINKMQVKEGDPRLFARQLNRSVRNLLSTSWIKRPDLECILCLETFTNPVTTPCGHMFCRTCIERRMDYGKKCPLCLRSLDNFNLNETGDTSFVQAALTAINALNVPTPLEPDYIPIFVCTVAYPSVPCPLLIFDPRYWLMIRRVLETGSRQFGMVACDGERRYADFGTILEVRDCVRLSDGRSILSTVGVARFKVMERCFLDGYEVARIMPVVDNQPTEQDKWRLKMWGTQVILKALTWLMQLNPDVLEDIETTFGRIPNEHFEEGWWKGADGPKWLWWLVAVVPLRSEIKVLILSTDCLLKRLMAVSRTLESLITYENFTVAGVTDMEVSVEEETPPEDVQPRRSTRERRPPSYLRDYVNT